jgi:undecaprenyl-diphosphatase
MLDAILLGLIQGITEFLPISSDGHLALTELLFGIKSGGLVFNVMLHSGTFLATLLVLRERVWDCVRETLLAVRKPARLLVTAGGRDVLMVVVASIPTAVIGLLLKDRVEVWTHDPLVIGLGFLGTAVLLISASWAGVGRLETPSLLGALLIGLMQGMAVLPGLSRSGATIATALWLGVRPGRAFELSMLMSLPAVLGAILLELPKARSLADGELAVVGAVVAFVSGVAALSVFGRVVAHGHFSKFALWVLPLALATLALAWRWPGGL